MQRKRLAVLVAVVALVTFAGCLQGGSRPSVRTEGQQSQTQSPQSTPTTSSNSQLSPTADPQKPAPAVHQAHIVVFEGSPMFFTDVSVDEYATLLIEGPNGRVIGESTVSPNASVHTVSLNPRPGTYRVKLRRDGTTIASQAVTYDGATATLKSVDPRWDGGKLKDVAVTVENTGDLPLRVGTVTVSARGKTMTGDWSAWIAANGNRTLSFSNYISPITIEQPGTVTPNVVVQTNVETLRTSFSRSFSGPRLRFRNVSQSWDGSDMDSVNMTVVNTGDMAVSPTIHLRVEGDVVADRKISLGAGKSMNVKFDQIYSFYSAKSPRTVTAELFANTSTTRFSKTITHTVSPPDVTLTSVTVEDRDEGSTVISATIKNVGDMNLKLDRVVISANGTSDTRSFVFTYLSSGQSRTITGYLDTKLTEGSHTVVVYINERQSAYSARLTAKVEV